MILAPIPHQFVDLTGVPYDGGMLYAFVHGSTEPALTFQDADGNAPNANPTVLDHRGCCTCFIDPAVNYDFMLYDKDGKLVESFYKVTLADFDSYSTAEIDKAFITKEAAEGTFATKADMTRATGDISAHLADTSNPHKVTAEQVDTYDKATIDAKITEGNGKGLFVLNQQLRFG